MQSKENYIPIENYGAPEIGEIRAEILKVAERFIQDSLNKLIESYKVSEITPEQQEYFDSFIPKHLQEEPIEWYIPTSEEIVRENYKSNRGPYVFTNGIKKAYKNFVQYINFLIDDVKNECINKEEEVELLTTRREKLLSNWRNIILPTKEYRAFYHHHSQAVQIDFCFKRYKYGIEMLCQTINYLIKRWEQDDEGHIAERDLTQQFSEFLLIKMQLQYLASRLRYLKLESTDENRHATNKKEKTPLPIIALLYFYQGKTINRKENADLVAKEYGWSSGEALFQDFSKYSSRLNRIAVEDTLKKSLNKLKQLETVISLLEPEFKEKAMNDVISLKTAIIDEYQESSGKL